MRKFCKYVLHGLLFSYVFYYVMTRDLETVYGYYSGLVVGVIS